MHYNTGCASLIVILEGYTERYVTFCMQRAALSISVNLKTFQTFQTVGEQVGEEGLWKQQGETKREFYKSSMNIVYISVVRPGRRFI